MLARCVLLVALAVWLAAPLPEVSADEPTRPPLVQFTVNGKTLKLNLVVARADDDKDDEAGEKEIPVADLPAAVKDAIEKKYPKCKILEAEMEKEGDDVEYEVEIMTADGKKLELEVSKDGKTIEVEDEDEDDEDDDKDDK